MSAHIMMYLYIGAALAMMLGMALLLGRLISGPSLYDRALAVNSFGTKVVLFLCLFSFIIGRADGVDIAILYTLMNFIATIAILKFFRYRALSGPLTALPSAKKFDAIRGADEQGGAA
jgi:multicomponent Na+:H+ antiporter subunit F